MTRTVRASPLSPDSWWGCCTRPAIFFSGVVGSRSGAEGKPVRAVDEGRVLGGWRDRGPSAARLRLGEGAIGGGRGKLLGSGRPGDVCNDRGRADVARLHPCDGPGAFGRRPGRPGWSGWSGIRWGSTHAPAGTTVRLVSIDPMGGGDDARPFQIELGARSARRTAKGASKRRSGSCSPGSYRRSGHPAWRIIRRPNAQLQRPTPR